MEYFDEINRLRYLFCTEVKEPFENELLISIKEAIISKQTEDVIIGDVNIGPANAILADGSSNTYDIYFSTYAAYCVTNESIAMLHKHEERVGTLLCVYSKSDYLDFIQKHTIAEHIWDGELKHYQINCLMHSIDIVSMSEPVICKT